MSDNQMAIAVIATPTGGKLTKTARHAASAGNARPVPHWGINEVLALVEAARQRGRGRKGDRDALLIQTIFDGALRVSEALGVRPLDILRTDGGYRLLVNGKTGPRQVAVSPSLVAHTRSSVGSFSKFVSFFSAPSSAEIAYIFRVMSDSPPTIA